MASAARCWALVVPISPRAALSQPAHAPSRGCRVDKEEARQHGGLGANAICAADGQHYPRKLRFHRIIRERFLLNQGVYS